MTIRAPNTYGEAMPKPFRVIKAISSILAIITLFNTARIVPQKQAFIVERLGKYARTLKAGLHILIPFIDRVAYKHAPPMFCFGLLEVADIPDLIRLAEPTRVELLTIE